MTIKADLRQIEPVIAHEMTHGCLGHLPLPAWLNEGLAMNVERRLSPTPQTHTPQQLRAKHLTFWTPQDIPLGAGGFSYEGGQLKGINLAQNASSTTQPLISQIQWQPFGPASSWLMHMASGTRSYERVFDAYGRLVRYPLNGVVRDLRYDAANRIVGYTHLDATTGQATAATQALEQAFGYDELGRLTTISTPAQSWTIGYDASGNRTQVTLNGTTRAYTTSATSNRLEQISNPVRSMSYDAAGNTLTDTTMYSSAVYSTDNRLTAITKAGQTTSYSYDAGGQRVSKSNAAAPAQARLFVYGSSPELLGEYAADGTAVQEVVWFDGQPLIVLGQANSNEVFFSYPDHLGAPRILVDRSGAERWRWIAEPFGSTAAETAPAGLAAVAFPLRLPGQYFDAETGLNYNYFRNYDSTIGQYTQSDPIGLAGGINTYAYVGGNPLGGIDPYGLFDITNPADWPQLPPGVAKCIESRRWDWGNMGPQGDGPPTLAGDLGTAGNLGNSAGNFAAGATGSGISSASHATSWQHRTGSQ